RVSSLGAALAGAAWMIIAALYLLSFWTLTGQTPGMDFMGLRVIAADGGPVSRPRAVRRLAGFYACILTLGAGFLLVVVDARRRAGPATDRSPRRRRGPRRRPPGRP